MHIGQSTEFTSTIRSRIQLYTSAGISAQNESSEEKAYSIRPNQLRGIMVRSLSLKEIQARQMRRLEELVHEGNMFELMSFARKLDYQERQRSGSSTDRYARDDTDPSVSRHIGHLFQVVADFVTAYQNDPEGGYASGQSNQEMDYLFGIAAKKFGAEKEDLWWEVDRLVEQNQAVNEFYIFMRWRAIKNTGYEATMTVWKKGKG